MGDADHFKSEVERIIAASRVLPPMPGQETAELAGALEWRRERDWAIEGIPLGEQHRALLEEIAGDLRVAAPW